MDRVKQAWKGSKPEKIWNWTWARKVDIGVWSFILFALVGETLIIILYVWPELNTPEENVDRVTLTVGTIGALFVGIVGLLNLYVNYRKTRTLEGTEERQRETIEQQRKNIKQQRESDRRRDQQQLYATNVQHLGSSSESVRIGAIYGLERLAKESQDWASKVAEILCAHIRIATNKDGYLKGKKGKSSETISVTNMPNILPDNEIITTLEVLTKGDNNPFVSTKLDLRWAQLKFAPILKANLTGSQLWGSNLTDAILSYTNFNGADLWYADLTNTHLEEAKLTSVCLQYAKLGDTHLKGAKLEGLYSASSAENMKDRVGKPTDLTGCTFSDDKPTDLSDIACGVLTQGLYDAIMKDQGTGKTENEDRYRKKYSKPRQPTQMDKERLVGKENVDKCKWGDIYVLWDEGIQESLELG